LGAGSLAVGCCVVLVAFLTGCGSRACCVVWGVPRRGRFARRITNHNNNLINNILNYILISASACAAESVISS
jgi:hypothetical protein